MNPHPSLPVLASPVLDGHPGLSRVSNVAGQPPVRCMILGRSGEYRREWHAWIEATENASVIAVCSSPVEAQRALGACLPDVLFLKADSDPDALAFARTLRLVDRPALIFISARPDLAVEAFDLNALDYLVEPVSGERLSETLRRIRDRVRALELTCSAESRIPSVRMAPSPAAVQLVVKSGRRVRIISSRDVISACAEANYVRLGLTSGDSALIRGALGDICRSLGPSMERVHKSCAVRLDAIRELRQSVRRDRVAVLTNGVTLRIGRRYFKQLMSRLSRSE